MHATYLVTYLSSLSMKCKQILRVCVAGQDDAELVVVDGVGVFILSEC